MIPPIVLESSRHTAGVSPALGGSLVWFGTRAGPPVDFVRPTPVRALHDGHARMASSYPLVPYSNRIAGGRFDFGGRSHALRRNTDVSEHPIHGIGFQRPWSIVASRSGRLDLALAHDGNGGSDPDWPWSFDALQSFELDDDRLSITIGIHNRDARAMPAGVGFHPFFPKTATTGLRFAADAMWTSDARMLPAARIAVPPPLDFRSLRPIGGLDVDNCFDGWDGTAELVWRDRGWGLRIRASDAMRHLVVFTGPGRDSIAIEPVSHVNDALNAAALRDDTGLAILAPGQALRATMVLEPFATAG